MKDLNELFNIADKNTNESDHTEEYKKEIEELVEILLTTINNKKGRIERQVLKNIKTGGSIKIAKYELDNEKFRILLDYSWQWSSDETYIKREEKSRGFNKNGFIDYERLRRSLEREGIYIKYMYKEDVTNVKASPVDTHYITSLLEITIPRKNIKEESKVYIKN